MEVQVANENAVHWRDNLVKANAKNRNLRLLLRRVEAIFQQNGVDFRTPELREAADTFMADLRKEIG